MYAVFIDDLRWEVRYDDTVVMIHFIVDEYFVCWSTAIIRVPATALFISSTFRYDTCSAIAVWCV